MKTTNILLLIACLCITVDHAVAAGKTPKLDVNRLFYTAAQRALISRLLANSLEPPTIEAVPEVAVFKDTPAPVVRTVKRRTVTHKKVQPPELNGYLLAGDKSVIWLDGKTLVDGEQYVGRVVRKVIVDDNVAFRIGADSKSFVIPPIGDVAGKLLLEVRP